MLLAILFACMPAQPVRGGDVECTARDAQPFVVLRREARAEGHTLVDASEQHVERVFTWAGIAAVDTEVTLTARTAAGVETVRAGFRVRPRSWPALRLPEDLPPWEYGDDAAFGGWPPRLRATDDPSTPIAADGSLGSFSMELPAPRTRYVEEGPNARWFIVAEPTPPLRVRVRVHRALRPGDPFALLQQGGARGAWPACGPSDVVALRVAVLQHEGALPSSRPSHYAETRRALQRRDLQREVEAMHADYDEAVAGDPLHERVRAVLQRFLDEMREEQGTTVDRAAPVRLPCRLRYP